MYFPEEEAAAGAGGETRVAEEPRREEAPLTMLVPMLVLAAGIVLLGLFNGEVVSLFIDHAIPVSFIR